MKPYVYKIRHISTGKYYVGCQYGVNSDPENFWKSYKTSSKIVLKLIEEGGEDSFEVVKISVRDDARDYESKFLQRLYSFWGKDKFLEKMLNRNVSPGIILTEEIINKANEKRKISNSIAAKKLFQENRHNFQLNPAHQYEHVRKLSSERMKGNNYGSFRIMDDNLKRKLSEKSMGNTNVRGTKWWYNELTGERRRCIDTPGKNWINSYPSAITEEGRLKIKKANSLPKSDEHKRKLSIAAKNRPSNAKGTIWVKNEEGKRKRVLPNNIPEGYVKL